jgi:hypothetical protein
MPMIRGITLTTTTSFVKSHEDQIRRLIRGFIDAIQFFLTCRKQTMEILKEHATAILRLQSDEAVTALHEAWTRSLERKAYPSLEAIANVLQLALRRNPEIAGVNPLALRDTRYL